MTNITRLWPVSRTLLAKQFVKLFDGRSLLLETMNCMLHSPRLHLTVI